MAAMQSSAINPVTGLVDIDLINSGISSTSRKINRDKVTELKRMLAKEKSRVLKFLDIYRKFSEQSNEVRKSEIGGRGRGRGRIIGLLEKVGFKWDEYFPRLEKIVIVFDIDIVGIG